MKKKVFAIIGSASERSANQKLVDIFVKLTADNFDVVVFDSLKTLPHFDPGLSNDNPPPAIMNFRKDVETADGVLICTPEYIFSIPAGLKNVIEWCVATTVFSDKPLGIITASLDGQAGHQELQMIMKTLMARFTEDTTLLIRGVKGKVSAEGIITDNSTGIALNMFIEAFDRLMAKVSAQV
jgi:chromate reductase